MPVGWVNKKNAILLDDAIPYFTSRIERNPKDWDAYLRRAESEHALNQREAAIADYTRAIELHPDEPFLFLRRGRAFRTMKACPQAAADFEKAANLKPMWAGLYNQAAGVYVDCPDPAYRNPEKAVPGELQFRKPQGMSQCYISRCKLFIFKGALNSGECEAAAAEAGTGLLLLAWPPSRRGLLAHITGTVDQ